MYSENWIIHVIVKHCAHISGHFNHSLASVQASLHVFRLMTVRWVFLRSLVDLLNHYSSLLCLLLLLPVDNLWSLLSVACFITLHHLHVSSVFILEEQKLCYSWKHRFSWCMRSHTMENSKKNIECILKFYIKTFHF